MVIPWLKLIQHAPTIVSLARELRQRTKRETAPAAPDSRADVQALAADLRRQAEVLQALAEQMETAAAALLALRRTAILALSVAAAAFLLAAVALVLLLLR